MRANRDTIFVVTLILALIASTGAALTAWASAGSRETVQVNGGGSFGSGLTTTVSTNGTPSSGSSAGSGGSSYNGGGAGGSNGGSSPSSSGGGPVVGKTDTIKIGGIFTESGGLDSTVEEDTVRACFNYYNAQGGINGHKLSLVSYDDGLSGTNAQNEAVKLDTSDHVFAIVGWLAPFGESPAATYFEQHGIPIIGGLGVPEEFGNADSFPVSPSFYNAGYLLGQYGAGTLHFKHPGIILTNTSGIQNVTAGIKDAAAKAGVTINNNDIAYVSFGETNFSKYILPMKSDGVDSLITQIDPYSYVRLYNAMQSNSFMVPHLAGAGIDKKSVDDTIGAPLHGVYSFMPYREAQGNPDNNAEVSLYLNTLGRYYNSQLQYVDAFSEGSWVACRVFGAALARVTGSVTRGALIQALNSGTYDIGGMATPLNYGATSGGGKNDANHCVLYITYNSSSRWQTAQGYTCH